MKTVKYVPKNCQGDKPTFSGFVELRLPTFDERCEFIESSNVGMTDDGKVDLGDISKRVRMIRQMVKLSEKHYVTVDLTKIATGEQLKSFEDLQYDANANAILIEISEYLIEGLLGNV